MKIKTKKRNYRIETNGLSGIIEMLARTMVSTATLYALDKAVETSGKIPNELLVIAINIVFILWIFKPAFRLKKEELKATENKVI